MGKEWKVLLGKEACEVCPEGSSHVMWKIETFIEEDARHKSHCTEDKDASVPFKAGTLGPHTVLPIAINCPIVFSWISLKIWISSLSKVILVLRKARSHRTPNLGYREAESPGLFDVLQKNSAQHMMQEQVHCCDEAANHHLPIASAFWIIWIVYAEECSSLMQYLLQIRCSTHSVILNVTDTQHTRSLTGNYHPHWLVQWNHHCSHMCIPVHSPWPPGYIMSHKPFLLY